MYNWIASACNMLGALVLALTYFKLGYALFTVGSIMWFIRSKTNSERTMWAFFTVCNILGSYNAWTI
jgi:hypothetical protein